MQSCYRILIFLVVLLAGCGEKNIKKSPESIPPVAITEKENSPALEIEKTMPPKDQVKENPKDPTKDPAKRDIVVGKDRTKEKLPSADLKKKADNQNTRLALFKENCLHGQIEQCVLWYRQIGSDNLDELQSEYKKTICTEKNFYRCNIWKAKAQSGDASENCNYMRDKNMIVCEKVKFGVYKRVEIMPALSRE